ncbi:MAG: BamA/TamA family outer membrane protein [Cyanobacteria bacterium]|jgi:hemolysin activation/secretion protein|nr:BamA/TamA family outer membrane protein [Cyanobacteria bacterium GSL.Bin1]
MNIPIDLWCSRSSLLFASSTVLGLNAWVIQPAYSFEDQNRQFNPDQVLISQRPDSPEDRFPQPQPLPAEPPSEEPILPSEETQPEAPTEEEQQNLDLPLDVTRIEVTGSTILTAEELDPIINPLEGRITTLGELKEAATAITQLYLERGYITSRAVVPPQEIEDGVVEIVVIEGSLEDVQIEGNRRLNTGYIRSRLELARETPFNAGALEDQLQLLQINPLFDAIEATLQAGEGAGKSDLVVTVEEANPWLFSLNVDNYTPPSTGSVRTGINVGHRNLTGLGDTLSLTFNRTVNGGSRELDANYTVPVNAKNGTLQLRTIIEGNDVTEDRLVPVDPNTGDELEIEGESERYEISFRQPVVRTPREEFALSLGFSHQRNQNFFENEGFGFFNQAPDEDGETRTSAIRLGQEYLSRDPKGIWLLRSLFSVGIDAFDATTNDAPVPDSRFFSWFAQAQRVQRLSQNNLLVIQADLQLTPDSLLSSEQFTIGGGQSVRGYRQNALVGDNGFRLSVEDRITLARSEERGEATLQVAPFVDMGAVWNSDDNTDSDLGDDTFLIGVGLGVIWQPVSGLNIRLDYAPPLINLDDDIKGDDIQDHGLYFSVFYQP